MEIPGLTAGIKITVFDETKVELGEGTFVELGLLPDLKMTVYQCREHAILAKGPHWLKLGGEMHLVPEAK